VGCCWWGEEVKRFERELRRGFMYLANLTDIYPDREGMIAELKMCSIHLFAK
jgi:hypothetical protein